MSLERDDAERLAEVLLTEAKRTLAQTAPDARRAGQKVCDELDQFLTHLRESSNVDRRP